MPLTVQPVRTRGDRSDFMRFLWTLYRDDPNWVPPLRTNQKELLGWKRHPFHETAEAQTFLARRDGEVVGRIAAIHNREHLRLHHDGRGFFGFFECRDDPQAAAALFDAAREWLAARGAFALRGPMNPSMNYECGLLIEGFDSPPTFMMTYNPPYYARLIEGCGFHKAQDLLAYIGHRDQLPELLARIGDLADKAQEWVGATVRTIDTSRFRQEVEMFLGMYNAAMEGTWCFVPIGASELAHLAGSLKHLIIPELAIATELDGRAVGAIFCLPDYNPTIKQIDGRLFPFGFIRLLLAKKHIKRVRIISINVVPELQRSGLGMVLMKGLLPKSLELGVESAEFSWVFESNDMARQGLRKGGAKVYKTYRIYDDGPSDA